MIQHDKYHINVIYRSRNTVILHIFIDIFTLLWYDNLIFWKFSTVRFSIRTKTIRHAVSILLRHAVCNPLPRMPFV